MTLTVAKTDTSSIVIDELSKSYEKSPGADATYAIQGVSFTVPRGQFVTLLGPSGCGKTTTLRCVAGLEQATAGRIEMGAQVVFDAARKQNLRPEDRPIAMVPQSYGIWPHMTVLDNAAFPMRHGRNRRRGQDVNGKALEMLEQVGLAGVAGRWATQLSGGQQQRLALARALLGEPEVLLLDEPLSNLDAKLRTRLRHELSSFQKQFGVTALYVTHDQSEALALSDKVIVMNRGHIEQVDGPEQLYRHPRTSFVADFIGSANLFAVGGASRSGDGIVLARTELGPVRCGRSSGEQDVHDGGFVCVRPEDVRVRPADGSLPMQENEFGATVQSAEYLGDRLELLLGAAELTITVSTRADTSYVPGQSVVIRFPAGETSYLAS